MKFVVVLLLVVALVMLGGFIWMICLGALAHIFNIPRLAIGFWPSLLVSLIVSVLLGGSRNSK